MKKDIKKYLIVSTIVFLVAFVINTNFIQISFVSGNSMAPKYKDGKLVFINKNYKEVDKGDVVLGKKNEIVFIKRVIAKENDKVIIKDGLLYVNDEVIKDYEYIEQAGIMNEEIVLSKNEFLVLGDNINQSIDSRDKQIGIITSNNIIGVLF